MPIQLREIILSLCALPLLALTQPIEVAAETSQADSMPSLSLQDSIEGDWRPETDRVRDASRHPSETLTFFGLEPGMTVVEASPGRGWYTRILAPYTNRSGGTYIAAGYSASDTRRYAQRSRAAFQEKFVDQPEIYGPITVGVLNPSEENLAPPGSADLILTFRNVHNWVPAGNAEQIFASFFQALRPGGVLGVVDHRLPQENAADEDLSTGYIHESTVVQLAENAGFVLEASSEVNRNEADSADHPYGVWTLKPTRLSAPFGSKPDPDFDRTPYDAIGESDRFTLRFRKPAS